jgi:hypothetical protein
MSSEGSAAGAATGVDAGSGGGGMAWDCDDASSSDSGAEATPTPPPITYVTRCRECTAAVQLLTLLASRVIAGGCHCTARHRSLARLASSASAACARGRRACSTSVYRRVTRWCADRSAGQAARAALTCRPRGRQPTRSVARRSHCTPSSAPRCRGWAARACCCSATAPTLRARCRVVSRRTAALCPSRPSPSPPPSYASWASSLSASATRGHVTAPRR